MTSRLSPSFFLGLFLFSFFVSISFPSPANAAIVPCGRNVDDPTTSIDETKPCTLCHLVIGGKKIIDWGLKVMTYVAIAIIVAMAILYIVSTGNEGLMKTAKGGLMTALAGFAVMLGAWLIINTTLRIFTAKVPGLVTSSTGFGFTCDTTSLAGTAVSTTGTGGTTPGGAQPLPVGINNYDAAFQSAGTSLGTVGGVDGTKFLKAIASAESGGNPNAQSAKGSCGLMQLKPETAGQSCDWLKAHPNESIQIAADYFKTIQRDLAKYNGQFSINIDDIIAAYNAGTGTQPTSSQYTKGPFAVSADCTNTPTPAWECPINAGGFAETQAYVKKVKGFIAGQQ
jgi:hypothetical protein